jgi:hypothetical protein
VRGPATAVSRQAPNTGPANVTTAYDDFDPAAAFDTAAGNGPGPPSNTNALTDEPRFLGDPALGQVRLRYDSALVDAGDPGGVGTATDDFAGDPRVVDGNGDGTVRRDIGAFEYQHRPPVVTAAASPSSGLTGDAFGWSASATDPDGDPIGFSWGWNDGLTIPGASVSRSFGSPGDYAGTVTATDATGLTATAGAGVSVGARPSTRPPDTPLPPRDTTAPSFSIAASKLTLTAKGSVALRMSCAAGEPEPCAGTLTLASAKKLGRKRRVLKLGTAVFRIAAGRTQSVKLSLPRSAATTVRRLRKLKVTAAAVARDSAGNEATARRTLTLVAARTRR